MVCLIWELLISWSDRNKRCNNKMNYPVCLVRCSLSATYSVCNLQIKTGIPCQDVRTLRKDSDRGALNPSEIGPCIGVNQRLKVINIGHHRTTGICLMLYSR